MGKREERGPASRYDATDVLLKIDQGVGRVLAQFMRKLQEAEEAEKRAKRRERKVA